ncbi:MAG TPA: MFS transporter [Pedobacter sp.]|uniref:MFS transporter n=1 Tax=Pedobacter sp. TaxID=1411316 RepID=UPI002CDE23DE|nr:MFS transporter [Pedobacter sp.]HMI02100.1 MFS transporter [Pedobacter sp.]
MKTDQTPTHSKLLPKAWLMVILLCVVGCLNYLDRIMITTMRESIVDALPMTDAQFGLLTSVFLWVYGLLSPFAGFLADRFNRSHVIIASLFVWSIVTYLTAHATSFEELLVTRALMGVSEACYLPAALALITDYHKGGTRSLATGIHMGGVMVGQSLGFLGGWIAERHHWTDAFSVFGAIGVVYAFVLALLLRDAPDRPDSTEPAVEKVNFFEAIKDLFKRKSFILLLVFWGLLGIVGWMIMGWLPTYYKEHFNLSQALAGLYATGYIYPVSLVGVLLGGILADYWAKKNPRGRVLVPAIGLAIAAPAIFIASSTGVVYIAIICFMFYALTRIFSDVNLMPILCMVSDKRYRATGYGVLNMFACIVGGAGIYVSGIMRDADVDLSILFKIAAGSMLLCAAILFTLKVKYSDEQA